MSGDAKKEIRPILCLKCSGPLVYGSNRGLCSFCYNKVLRHIKLGLTTWVEEIRKGKARPAMTYAEMQKFNKTRPRGGKFNTRGADTGRSQTEEPN